MNNNNEIIILKRVDFLDRKIKGIGQNIKKVINSLVGIDIYIANNKNAMYIITFFTLII